MYQEMGEEPPEDIISGKLKICLENFRKKWGDDEIYYRDELQIYCPNGKVKQRKTPSINTTKGGKGIYDRIDLCLDEIKNAYEQGFEGKAKHKQSLWKEICEEKEWFELFGRGCKGFPNFINFFLLDDYVNENYDVISLSISNCREGGYKLVKEECQRINQYKISTESNCYLPGRQFGLNLQEDEAKAAYRQYINNCIFLIEKRTESMLKKLSV